MGKGKSSFMPYITCRHKSQMNYKNELWKIKQWSLFPH